MSGTTVVDLLTEDIGKEIPVMHIFDADICVRGVHYYKIQPDVGVMLDFYFEDEPTSLIHDRYAIAVKINGDSSGRKIGHAPKFISRFLYHFLRHGGTVTGCVIGAREFSFDLEQGGLQIPVKYSFTGSHRMVEILRNNILRLIQEKYINA